MDSMRPFVCFWLGGVVLLGVGHAVWALRDVRAGIAEIRYFGPYFRDGEPFGFWVIVGAKLATALLVAPGMFRLGLGVLNR